MRVIALDTTTKSGSVALLENDRVLDEREGDGRRTHAQRLPAEITEVVEAHGVTLADVDLYAVASGPGSFTGLRIGIATIQGLAFVHGRRVVSVGALDALAQMASLGASPGTVVAALMDAHRGEVFGAIFRVAAGAPFTRARLDELEGPTVGDPASTLARWGDLLDTPAPVFMGDGAVLYRDAIMRAHGAARVLPAPLLAGAVGRLALERQGDAVEPGELRAFYVRRPDVELERDRSASVVR